MAIKLFNYIFPSLILLLTLNISHAQTTLLSKEDLDEEPLYYQLERALEEPDKVYRLYIDALHTSWEDAKQLLPSLIHLQSITLSGEYFEELPAEFMVFRNQLQEITFQDNPNLNIERVCEQLASFPNLNKLGFEQIYGMNVFMTRIITVPKTITQLKSLKQLSFDYTPIGDLPPYIGELKQLEILSLQSSQLTSIPRELSKAKKLHTLYLGCAENGQPNKLQTFPEAILKMSNLKVLDLNKNGFTSIPEKITKLKQLEVLNLSSCPGLKAKNAIESIYKSSSLKVLDLSNVIMGGSVPKEIGKMRNLEWLSLRGCAIVTLPQEFYNLGNLEHLDLRKNNLSKNQTEKVQERFVNANL